MLQMKAQLISFLDVNPKLETICELLIAKLNYTSSAGGVQTENCIPFPSNSPLFFPVFLQYSRYWLVEAVKIIVTDMHFAESPS